MEGTQNLNVPRMI